MSMKRALSVFPRRVNPSAILAGTETTADVLDPVSGDANLMGDRISNLDKLYLAVSTALDNLVEAVGLEAA